ncbi:Subunit of the glycosylphosphatidylinositol transamidase complex-like protein [Tilletia horrida]|uniref:Subunit of the glycosylphosphatidylinositol transamidase complex-like protein n=1 Tax=Tilletia horrida TaxID=155126 RepID=A0AAN6GG24_9BASI|nr:Subunit of the glycosylphosphatidylinositol transamidase complex-like protein [Tilletia horrida]
MRVAWSASSSPSSSSMCRLLSSLLLLLAVSGAAAAAATLAAADAERFDEDLLLRPLPDGGIHAAFHFNIDSGSDGGGALDAADDGFSYDDDAAAAFRSNASASPSWLSSGSGTASAAQQSHFRLLPRSLIQIAQAANTREFKLSISAGSWQYSAWGEPTLDVLTQPAATTDSYSSSSRSASSRLWGGGGAASRRGSRSEQPESIKVLGDDSVGNGAELWASFLPPVGAVLPGAEGPSKNDHARLSWRKLTSALAGLFCASLDTTLSPRVALQPSDAHLFAPLSRSHNTSQTSPATVLLHAFAPSETICTENLTPFLKLLPCRSASAGLAQLLNPHALFSSAYHGMSIHVIRHTDGADASERWRVELRVQAVYTAAQARLRGRTSEELALRPLFNRNITQACPLAATSNVYVPRPPRPSDRQHDDDDDDEDAAPDEDILLLDADQSDSYQLPSWPRISTLDRVSSATAAAAASPLRAKKLLSRRRTWRASEHSSAFSDVALSGLALAYDLAPELPSEAPSLEVYRTHTSAHPTRGTFVLTLTNRHPSEPVRARYYDELPWWVKLWVHTLRVVKVEDLADCEASLCLGSASSSGRRASTARVSAGSSSSPSTAAASDDIVRFVEDFLCPPILALHYEPSAGRDLSSGATPGSGRPTLLELDLRIPASSRVKVQMEYDLAFLRYTEHPPGPQKGWGIPPGVLVVLGPQEQGEPAAATTTTADGETPLSSPPGAGNPELLCPVHVPRPRPGQTQRRPPSSSPLSMLPPLPRPVPVAGRGIRRRVYTEAALIELAVPDFSMIYNLILFTSTEVALFFGSMFNLLVRRFGDVTL